MVPRYTREQMAAIWSPENRFRLWFEIEALVAEAMARLGTIPESAAAHHPRAGCGPRCPHHAGRPRPHRRDRAGDPPRRHRLPDLAGRGDRPGLPFRASGPDQQRRAGHLPVGADDSGGRPAAARRGRRAGRPEGARLRAQIHPDHRPQPRHPRRAHHVRPEARRPLCRVRPQPRPAGDGPRRDCRGGDQRRGRHLRPCRSAHRGVRGRAARPAARAGLDPGDPARPPCGVLLRPGGDRQRHRAAGHRDPPSATHRSAGGGGILPPRPEGQQWRCPTSATRS